MSGPRDNPTANSPADMGPWSVASPEPTPGLREAAWELSHTFDWLTYHYPKAFVEMPRDRFRAIDRFRAALAASPAPEPHPTLSQPWGDPDYDHTCADCRDGRHGRLAVPVAEPRCVHFGSESCAMTAAPEPIPGLREAAQRAETYLGRWVDIPAERGLHPEAEVIVSMLRAALAASSAPEPTGLRRGTRHQP